MHTAMASASTSSASEGEPSQPSVRVEYTYVGGKLSALRAASLGCSALRTAMSAGTSSLIALGRGEYLLASRKGALYHERDGTSTLLADFRTPIKVSVWLSRVAHACERPLDRHVQRTTRRAQQARHRLPPL